MTTLRQRLDDLVGKPVSGTGESVADDPVNLPMIRHWVAAFEDANPIYLDPAGPVAPPTMLQTWTFASPVITGIAERGGAPTAVSGESALSVLDEAGFTGTLASNSEFEIERYLELGEVVSARTVIESISEEKQTRLGAGHFVTWVTDYTVSGELVGRQRFRILKFKP